MTMTQEQINYENGLYILKYKLENPKTKYTNTEIIFICKFKMMNPHIHISDKEILKKHDILDKEYDSSKKTEKKENILDKNYDFSKKTTKKGKRNMINSIKKNLLNICKNVQTLSTPVSSSEFILTTTPRRVYNVL